jgi:hypothetical protein
MNVVVQSYHGIEYGVRKANGRDHQWTYVIHFPGKDPTAMRFSGTRESLSAARQRIRHWLEHQQRRNRMPRLEQAC